MLLELPRIERSALLARLAAGHAARTTVVTPNRRLARSLQRDFDADRTAAGLTIWETADILPFDAFLERLWEDALNSPLGGKLPLLLCATQQQALWEETLRAHLPKGGLLSVPSAARQCREAWELAHEWALKPRLGVGAHNEDARAFVAWAGAYERATRERGQTDGARLVEELLSLLPDEVIAKPAELVLYGFDLSTPRLARFLEVLATGTRVITCARPFVEAQCSRVEFATPADELNAVARWARSRLEANPAARIGIVVPELGAARGRVRRSLARVLCPGEGLATARNALPFDVSLGLPLSAYPLARDALALLRLAGPEVAFTQASVLLRSPFLAGAESEMASRARVDAKLRETAGAMISLDAIVRMLSKGAPRTPILVESLSRLAEFRKSSLFTPRTASEWARAFSDALKVAGFPGERTIDSAEHQTLGKWHELLAAFAALDHVAGKLGYGDACSRLERMATDTLFQPESPEVPIEVLGTLESVGLAFDHLWVTGLTDEAWPRPARPNPFLALGLQREAAIPQADPAAALALDRRITEGWRGAAREVVFSHARTRDDSDVGPSPLIMEAALAPRENLPGAGYRTLHQVLHQARDLEELRDARGPKLEGAVQGGGIAIFKDQAACAFRGFVRHRLGSEPLETPRPGLDARDRGTLLHQVLADAWREIGSKTQLDALAGEALEELVDRCAREAIAAAKRRRGDTLRGRFAEIERQRLARIAREWLEFERSRDDFEVVAVEQKRPVTFGGVTVNARLDRMDRLAGGGHAVLDYKTGAAVVSAWLGPRPDDPQLPLYVLGAAGDVRAVAFARVKRGGYEFCGLAVKDGLVPKVKTIGVNRSRLAHLYPDWDALLAGWRRELDALGRGFAEGEAAVAPKEGDLTCAHCQRQMLCRVAEKMPMAFDPPTPDEELEEEGT